MFWYCQKLNAGEFMEAETPFLLKILPPPVVSLPSTSRRPPPCLSRPKDAAICHCPSPEASLSAKWLKCYDYQEGIIFQLNRMNRMQTDSPKDIQPFASIWLPTRTSAALELRWFPIVINYNGLWRHISIFLASGILSSTISFIGAKYMSIVTSMSTFSRFWNTSVVFVTFFL